MVSGVDTKLGTKAIFQIIATSTIEIDAVDLVFGISLCSKQNYDDKIPQTKSARRSYLANCNVYQ